mgnify:FL=1
MTDKFGKTCKNKEEQDALIQLAFAYVEDQQKLKLSKTYHITSIEFKGDPKTIREDFGLGKDPMKEEMEKLAKSFAPVADIATKDPSLLEKLSNDSIKTSQNDNIIKEEMTADIRIPGMTNRKSPAGGGNTQLIEEVRITPSHTLSHKVSTIDGSRSLIVKINLEKIESVNQCTLDISEV